MKTKKIFAQLIAEASADIGRDNAKRPSDRQLLRDLKKKYPHLTREQIADMVGMTI